MMRAGFTAILLLLTAPAAAAPWPFCEGKRERFGACVVDGDTIWFAHEKIRLSGIDAPENARRAECMAEEMLAALAADALSRLMDGDVELERKGEDRFGRTLAIVHVDGRDVGQSLVEAGLAQVWTGRAADWCSR